MWHKRRSYRSSGGAMRCGLAALVLLLAGCQAARTVPTLGDEQAAQVADGSVVFGKISVIGRDGPVQWKGITCQEVFTFDCPDVFHVYVYAERDGEPFGHMLSGDGSFYWVLAPGAYTIGGFELEDWDEAALKSSLSGRIAGRFVVPPQVPSVYLGTTNVYLSGSRYIVEVVDEFESAKKEFEKQAAVPSGNPNKSLAVVERIPGEEDAVEICSGGWGIECTKENRGVRALEPAVQRDDFAPAPSLTPLLGWTPSSDPDVTYDVVVFEALPIGRPSLNRSHILGPVVELAQGIEAPRYEIKGNLKPSTNYYWSVRLRKGDTVSGWSTVSYRYFAFLVIAAVSGSGSGVYFGFRTP